MIIPKCDAEGCPNELESFAGLIRIAGDGGEPVTQAFCRDCYVTLKLIATAIYSEEAD
jgi:hypothetical protein